MDCFITSYPYTCDPADILANQQAMRKTNWYCSDVQVRGEYPAFAKRLWEDLGVTIHMEPGDAEILKEGTVDFYTFSYYMSNCITTHKDAAKTDGNVAQGFKNPYLQASEWGWQIDPPVSYTHLDVYKRQPLYHGDGRRRTAGALRRPHPPAGGDDPSLAAKPMINLNKSPFINLFKKVMGKLWANFE